MKVLAISSSQRRHGNSETLLDEALSAINKKAASIKKVVLCDLNISPCAACEACFKTGECVIKDDMQALYKDLLSCDILLIASPMYFQGLPCRLKCLIDRCQALWARKYILKKRKRGIKKEKRRGAAILVSASSGLKDTFTGAIITLKAWFKTLDVVYEKEFLAQGLEGKDAASGRRALLAKAVKFGRC